MKEYIFRDIIDLTIKVWSIFWFSAVLTHREKRRLMKIGSLLLFSVFVLGQRYVLSAQTLENAFIRNILLYLLTIFVELSFYDEQKPYLVFIGSTVYFLWGGWLKLFTPFVFHTLHFPAFGYGIQETFPIWITSLAEAVCRILVFAIMRCFAFHVCPGRTISAKETFLALLPALIDHTTILILYYLMIVSPSLQSQQIAGSLTLLILLLVFGMPCMLAATENIFQAREKYLEVLVMESQLRSQLQSFEESRLSDEKMRQVNHDFQNHLAVIRSLSADGNDAASCYIDEILDQYADISDHISTGNLVADALFGQKARLCLEKDISLDCLVDLTKVTFIKYADMVTLFANALDNAIEAVENLTKEKRIIQVRIGIIGDHVVAKFVNPCEREIKRQGKRFLTQKRDTDFHGIGLSNIEKIVSDYQGTLSIDTADNLFILRWMIPIPFAD